MTVLSINNQGLLEGLTVMFTVYGLFGVFGIMAIISAIRAIKILNRIKDAPDSAQSHKILAWNLFEPGIMVLNFLFIVSIFKQILVSFYKILPNFFRIFPFGTFIDIFIYFWPIIVITQIIPRRNRHVINTQDRLAYTISAQTGLRRMICYMTPYLIMLAIFFINIPIVFPFYYIIGLIIGIGLLVVIQRSLSQVYNAIDTLQKPQLAIVGGKQGTLVTLSNDGSSMQVLIDPETSNTSH